MSSFFTLPASQRKRKRSDDPTTTSKKRNVTSTAAKPSKAPRRTERDDSISGSESSDEEQRGDFFEDEEGSDSSADENETAAERRLRLAEQYLENIKNEVQDNIGFDARDLDRDLIAERLVEDVAESKGKVYRTIAQELDFEAASHVFGKSGLQRAITGCAVHLPYAWTVSKDLVVEKWEIADPKTYNVQDPNQPTNISPRRTPKKLFWRKGNKNKAKDRAWLGHTGPILSIAVSDSGKFLATGDANARLIIWDADTLTPRKLFTQHRDAVTALAFRRGTEQLYSASADRSVKIFSAPELAYIETLHGHEDTVVGIASGLDVKQETCISVGARDRSARLWKVVEENQLVFRGGGTARQKGMEKLRKGRFGGNIDKDDEDRINKSQTNGIHEDDTPVAYGEGSVDCVAALDSTYFVTGSDNGSLSLWSTLRKKPLFTIPLTHGRDRPIPPEEMSADANITAPRLPRYITALATVPFADMIVTASWDGWIRAFRIGAERQTIEAIGKVGRIDLEEDGLTNGTNSIVAHDYEVGPIRGIVNGLSVCERGERGKEGLCIVAAVGKEPKLGRWMVGKGRNGIAVFEVPKRAATNGVNESSDEEEDG